MSKRYSSVWDAIEGSQVKAENLKLRSALMMELANTIERKGLTQAQAANALGVAQPRVSDLVHGKIEKFSVDSLVNMLAAMGLHVEARIRRAA